MAISVIVLLLFQSLMLTPLSLADPTGTKCPPAPGRTESCVCQAQDGVIDITLLSKTDGKARLWPAYI